MEIKEYFRRGPSKMTQQVKALPSLMSWVRPWPSR